MSTSSAVKEDTSSDAEADEAVSESNGNDKSSKFGTAIERGKNAGDSAIKVKTLVTAATAAVLVIGVGVMGWQLHAKSNDLDQVHRSAADRAHAEQIALDYATGAADMDFHDLAAWRGRLTKGTSPELSNRLTQASQSMEQIISPLQWSSTAKPIAAKVRSEANGAYSVDCFVSVMTKNSQAPEGIQSTATYRLTIDSHNNWTITDIGGIDAALGGSKSAPVPSGPAPAPAPAPAPQPGGVQPPK